jgi:hypothetical protein
MPKEFAQQYREKAEECRRLAESKLTEIDRRLMLALATDFDHKAEIEEEKRRGRAPLPSAELAWISHRVMISVRR